MRLTAQQIDRFEEEGFLVVRQALGDADLDPVTEEYEAHIDRRAGELKAEAKISDVYADAPFDRRLALICRECRKAPIHTWRPGTRTPASLGRKRIPCSS
jgi:hypothetical protein